MNKTRFMALTGVILLAALARLLPHPPNFAPVAAIALFGGAHFRSRWAAFGVPLLAMFLSDVILGFFVYGYGLFHTGMPFVYGSFLAIVGLGMLLRRLNAPAFVPLAALTSSVLFFAVTNFGVWLGGQLYPRTWEGLVTCYTMALPFFRYTVLGDLCWVTVLFGGFALAQHFATQLRRPSAPLPDGAA